MDPFSRQMNELYGFYADKVLAIQGGVLDQPNAYIEAMQIIGQVYQEYREVGK